MSVLKSYLADYNPNYVTGTVKKGKQMKHKTESILVCSAEVFVLQYWLDKYHRYFKNEFDRFHLVLNWGGYWRSNPYLIDYVRQMLPDADMIDVKEEMSPGHDDSNISAFGMTPEQRIARKDSYEIPDTKELIYLTSVDTWHRQGGADNLVLPFIDSEYLVMWDNDCFCFQSGIISSYVELMEEQGVHVIGTTGQWVSQDLMDELGKRKWYGRVNPFFSIFDTSKCFAVEDVNFDCRNFAEGEHFPPFDHVVPEGKQYVGDQYTILCLQLQAMGVKTGHIGDNETPDFDIMDAVIHTHGTAPLFHIGNMGGHSYYIAPGNRPDSGSMEDRLKICEVWNEIQNLRTYVWLKVFKDWSYKNSQETGMTVTDEMEQFYKDYEENLQLLKEKAKLTDEICVGFARSQYEHRPNTRDLFESMV